MEKRFIFIIVILVLILIIIGLIFYAAYAVTKKVRSVKRQVQSVSRTLFGTSSITEGIKKTEQEYASTPKSVSGATSLCLPRITKDFPDFNYEEMKRRAENVLLSYLAGVSARDVSRLKDANSELKNSLQSRIDSLSAIGNSEHYDAPKIHRTEINNYNKNAGRCSIVFQTSIQYRHYVTDQNGNCIRGNKNTWEQSRYNIELIYIQDRDIVENDIDGVEGQNCPNCCAPLKMLGAKKCVFCGTPIVEYNIKVWTFSSIKEA